MPNWAENILTITGAPGRIEQLRAYIAGTDEDNKPLVLDFQKVIPTPLELRHASSPNSQNPDANAKFGYPDWYEFQKHIWGTYWNLSSVDVAIVDNGDESEFVLRFLTAWSPPKGIIRALGAIFPDLTFDLWTADSAMDWGYHLTMENGRADETDMKYTDQVKEIFGHQDEEDEVAL